MYIIRYKNVKNRACPYGTRSKDKEQEKLHKYQDLEREISGNWKCKEVGYTDHNYLFQRGKFYQLGFDCVVFCSFAGDALDSKKEEACALTASLANFPKCHSEQSFEFFFPSRKTIPKGEWNKT